MKYVLKSVKPKQCVNIANSKQTILVCKTSPKEFPFKCYIYCTKEKTLGEILLTKYGQVCGRNQGFRDDGDIPLAGKVIGEFICNRVEEYEANARGWYIYPPGTCLLCDEIAEYGNGKTLYGWHISDLKVYNKPKELNNFTTICTEWKKYAFSKRCKHCKHSFINLFGFFGYGCRVQGEKKLTRPPQSWKCVEELTEEE